MSLLPEGFQRLPLLLEAFFAFMERARLRREPFSGAQAI